MSMIKIFYCSKSKTIGAIILGFNNTYVKFKLVHFYYVSFHKLGSLFGGLSIIQWVPKTDSATNTLARHLLLEV